MMSHFLTLKILSFILSIDSLINVYLSVVLFELILARVYVPSWTCRLKSSITLEKFLPSFFSNVLSLLSHSEMPIKRILELLLCPTGLWGFAHSSSSFFCSLHWIILTDQSSSLLILSFTCSTLILNTSKGNFHFSCFTLKLQNFYLVLFYNFSLYWYSVFDETSWPYFLLVL